ncbi:hypothetical protein NNO71_14320 [Enterococcus faecium]|nr:hypothetical protein [Enterococcus faecium]
MVDIGLAILFSAVFGVSHVQILHDKMIKNDADYKINVMDERNIIIKEKAGNITNMFNTILLGVATVIFICLDYIIPAIIVGSIIAIQPIILIIISSVLEKKNVEDKGSYKGSVAKFPKNLFSVKLRKKTERTE